MGERYRDDPVPTKKGLETGFPFSDMSLPSVSNTGDSVDKEWRWTDELSRGTITVPSVRAVLNFCLKSLIFLLPSFLQSSTRAPTSPSQTAHLDGLRGVAAFLVYVYHASYISYPVRWSYGGVKEENHHEGILFLPGIRLLWAGAPWVAVFFIISGYALSYKPVKQMRAGAFADLLRTESSQLIRRAMRLYLPAFAATFIIMLLVWGRYYESTLPIATSWIYHREFHEYHKGRFDIFALQFWDWLMASKMTVWVFTFDLYGGMTSYDAHLWTIPNEFRCSLALFMTHITVSTMRPRMRFVTLVLWLAFCHEWGRWDLGLFICGFMLAEYDLTHSHRSGGTILPRSTEASRSPSGLTTHIAPQYLSWLSTTMWWSLVCCGLFLMSYPEEGDDTTPGYIWLSAHVHAAPGLQRWRFWPAVGAVQLVWAVNNIPVLQRLLNTSFIRYLGSISYGLYLMHGPVLHTIGYHVMKFWWTITGTKTEAMYSLGFVLSFMTFTPAVIWAGDVFWRAVDLRAVDFARWIEGKIIVKRS